MKRILYLFLLNAFVMYAAEYNVSTFDDFLTKLKTMTEEDTLRFDGDIKSPENERSTIPIQLIGNIVGNGHKLHIESRPLELKENTVLDNLTLSLKPGNSADAIGLAKAFGKEVSETPTITMNGYNLTLKDVETNLDENSAINSRNVKPVIIMGQDLRNLGSDSENTLTISGTKVLSLNGIIAGSTKKIKKSKSIIDIQNRNAKLNDDTGAKVVLGSISNDGTILNNMVDDGEIDIKTSSPNIRSFLQNGKNNVNVEVNNVEFKGTGTFKMPSALQNLKLKGNSTYYTESLTVTNLEISDESKLVLEPKLGAQNARLEINSYTGNGTIDTRKREADDDFGGDEVNPELEINNINGNLKVTGDIMADNLTLPEGYEKSEDGTIKPKSESNLGRSEGNSEQPSVDDENGDNEQTPPETSNENPSSNKDEEKEEIPAPNENSQGGSSTETEDKEENDGSSTDQDGIQGDNSSVNAEDSTLSEDNKNQDEDEKKEEDTVTNPSSPNNNDGPSGNDMGTGATNEDSGTTTEQPPVDENEKQNDNQNNSENEGKDNPQNDDNKVTDSETDTKEENSPSDKDETNNSSSHPSTDVTNSTEDETSSNDSGATENQPNTSETDSTVTPPTDSSTSNDDTENSSTDTAGNGKADQASDNASEDGKTDDATSIEGNLENETSENVGNEKADTEETENNSVAKSDELEAKEVDQREENYEGLKAKLKANINLKLLDDSSHLLPTMVNYSNELLADRIKRNIEVIGNIENSDSIWVKTPSTKGKLHKNIKYSDNTVLVGAEKVSSDNFKLGFAVGIGEGKEKLENSKFNHNNKVNTTEFYHYGEYIKNNNKLNYQLGLGFAKTKTQRKVENNNVFAKYNSNVFSAGIGYSHKYDFKNISIEPTLNLNYVLLKSNSYKENGNSPYKLNVPKNNYKDLDLKTAIRAVWNYNKFSASIETGVILDLLNNKSELNYTLVGDENVRLNLKNYKKERVQGNISFGVGYKVTENAEVFLKYDTRVSKYNKSQSGMIGFKYTF